MESDEGIAARRTRLIDIVVRSVGRDGDHGDGMQRRVRLETASSLVAVKDRELDVHENEVRVVHRRRNQSRLTVLGFDDLEIGAGEQVPQDLPIVFLILDHQDAIAHHGPACASTRTGSVK
jgi:hypothetical protein